MDEKKKKSGAGAVIKESFRKMIVSLKRQPQMIPLLVLAVAFLEYSLNLTQISNTTARIQASGMGLAGFATMLFSILVMVCCMNSFPRRKKANIPFLVLTFAMLAIILFADWYYVQAILSAVNRPENPIIVTTNTIYIANAVNILNTHMIILAVAIVSIVFLPVYSKWIRKIKTSIEVEDNGNMATIDIAED